MERARVAAVRRFNRFYTQRIGMLRPALYESPYSLAEARVLYELAHAGAPTTASDVARLLAMDAGYLSRMLSGFVARGLVRRTRSARDGREYHLALTAAGRKAFASLDRASAREIGALLAPLDDGARSRLVGAMATIESALCTQPAPTTAPFAARNAASNAAAGGAASAAAPRFTLRAHRPGDIGWVIARHGALYAQEHGWDIAFEAMVARIAARFVERFDPRFERCWIAERDGANAGCAFVVRRSARVAQLRMLLVEPAARGVGIGRALVAESLAFARATGYRKMMLWTNAGLDAARHLYDDAGFRLVAEEPHRSFGKDLIGQTFELAL
jgi:DNA-binding MarR family transcriptional regulator/N-acetylglutamate synthase-like GNAT family acetyltransferase